MASSSKIGTATATWNLIVTNHLGTQVYALTSAGAQHWIGGFEPFGQDYQQGTGQDSLTKGLFLRLPGQWDDTLLAGATLGADVFYNVHRWYETGTGRYTRSDPQGLRAGPHLFGYAFANPVHYIDPLGLVAWSCSNIEFSVGQGIMGGLFYIECESECVNGRRARGSYGAGGAGPGETIGIEISGWTLEDGTSTPNPGNLEGPFGIGNCSATPLVGVSTSTVHQGIGHGTWSPGPSFGFGAGCFALAGGVKMFDSSEECCGTPPDTPTIRAAP